jgi:hypothetical protein
VWLGLAWTVPPAVVPASAPLQEFSAERARAHLDAIARVPRPPGSPAHAAARAYIADRLRALDLEPVFQDTVIARSRFGITRLFPVHNVMARKRSSAGGKALLLMAHYDSRSMTPGASDDGAGVATLLETARALKDSAPLARDVIVLFTDGEELGLLGAHAFVTEHPWAKEVGAVLNFEARGDRGPVLMFQTSDGNGALARALVAAPHIAANSLSQAIYRRMPNDTDLSEWLSRAPSLNFANIGGLERYHAPTDTLDNLDLRTLQHHGSYALALAREIGNRDLPVPREPDATYFNVGPFFVRYSASWDTPLAIAAALLWALFLVLGHKRGLLRAPHALLAVAPALGVVALGALAPLLLWWLAANIHPLYRFVNAASHTMKSLYLASFIAVAAAIALLAEARLLRRFRASELFAGGSALFVLAGALAAASLPGSAFLFTWPLLIALPIALAFDLDRNTPAAIAAAIPALVLVAPFVPQLFAAFGPDAAPLTGALAALLAVFAAPAERVLLAPAPRLVSAGALAIALLAYLTASLHPPFDRAYPRPDTLVFAVDADRGKAFWMSPDETSDAFTAPALAGARWEMSVPLPIHLFDQSPVRIADTASPAEPAPALTWLDESPSPTGRVIRARVTPPPGALLVAARIEGATRASVAGVEVGLTREFRFSAPPPEGFEITLPASREPVTIHLVSQRPGFPAGATPALGPRPEGTMAKPGMMAPWDDLWESDMTLVARSFTR